MNIGESKISYYFVDIVIAIKVPKLKNVILTFSLASIYFREWTFLSNFAMIYFWQYVFSQTTV